MTILRRISAILALIVMVNGQDWRKMASETIEDIQKRASNLAPYAQETDQVYGDLFKSGPAGDFITNIMGQETLYGSPLIYGKDNTYSMGLTQIDPIRYQDLLTDYSNSSVYQNRVNKINEYMQSKPGYEGWDMTKLATIEDNKYSELSKYANDPLTNFMTTRMMLMKDPRPVPQNIVGQAGLWKHMWNTLSGAGDITEFADKYNVYRPVEATMYRPGP